MKSLKSNSKKSLKSNSKKSLKSNSKKSLIKKHKYYLKHKYGGSKTPEKNRGATSRARRGKKTTTLRKYKLNKPSNAPSMSSASIPPPEGLPYIKCCTGFLGDGQFGTVNKAISYSGDGKSKAVVLKIPKIPKVYSEEINKLFCDYRKKNPLPGDKLIANQDFIGLDDELDFNKGAIIIVDSIETDEAGKIYWRGYRESDKEEGYIKQNQVSLDLTPLHFFNNDGPIDGGEAVFFKNHDIIAKLQESKKKDIIKDFKSEIYILKLLFQKSNHLNLVKFIGHSGDEANPYRIMLEFCDYGSLEEQVENNDIGENNKFNLKLKDNNSIKYIEIIRNIANGMEYISSKDIVHRDLAARNVLLGYVSDKVIAKIADFGLSRELTIDESDVSNGLTYIESWNPAASLPWTLYPLESITLKDGNNTYTKKTDVWSYGILLFELFYKGDGPYYSWKAWSKAVDDARKQKSLKDEFLSERISNDNFAKIPEPILGLLKTKIFVPKNAREDFSQLKIELANYKYNFLPVQDLRMRALTTNIFARFGKKKPLAAALNIFEIGIVLNNSMNPVTDEQKQNITRAAGLVSKPDSFKVLSFEEVKNMLGLLYLAQSNKPIELSNINAYTPVPELNNPLNLELSY